MKYNKGLIKEILIIVIALIILGALGYNIKDIINSPSVQANLSWFWSIILVIWSWISAPVMWIWNTLIIGVLVNGIKAGLGK